MELERIIEILEKHQEWRRDQNVPPKTEMQSPIEIGTAIDYALSELKKLRLGDVSVSDFNDDLQKGVREFGAKHNKNTIGWSYSFCEGAKWMRDKLTKHSR